MTLIALLIALGVAATFCIILYGFTVALPATLPPDTYPRQQVESLMEAVIAHSGESMPTDLPDRPLGDTEKCWKFLQDAMKVNNNRYDLVVTGIFGDGGTAIPNSFTGTTSVVIEVRFPDGQRAQMDFYASTFDRCQEIKD